MNFPTWTSLGESAINKMPTWGGMFNSALLEIRLQQEIASVAASWFAVENPDQIEAEAKRRLGEKLSRGE